MVEKKCGWGEAGLVQSLPALLLWFQSAFLPQIPGGLSEGLESSEQNTMFFVCQQTIFEHFLFTGKKLTRLAAQLSSPLLKPYHNPALRLSGRDGPWVPVLSPSQALGSTVRTPAHFPVFQGTTSSRLKSALCRDSHL